MAVLLRTAVLFFLTFLLCSGAEGVSPLKGIKSVENCEIEFFLKKGESVDLKSKEVIDRERVNAVSKFYNIKVSGNGSDITQMKMLENERAKLKIAKESTAGWEIEERGEDLYVYRTTASFAVKDEPKKMKKKIAQDLKIDKEGYKEGEYQKVKLFLDGEGYYAFFVIYDNMSVRFIEPPVSNKKRYVAGKSEEENLGEWELIYIGKPEKSGKEQVLYSIVSKEYIDFEEKMGEKPITIAEFAQILSQCDTLSETTVKYSVEER